MTVGQLQNLLLGKDRDMQVFITQTNDEYTYSLLETAELKTINFSIEVENGVETAEEQCLILTDEI